MRRLAVALLVLMLGQAVGLPALAGPCGLADCADDRQGTCATPCAACLCCSTLRAVPPIDAAPIGSAVVPSGLSIDCDAIPPESPSREILHVPKA